MIRVSVWVVGGAPEWAMGRGKEERKGEWMAKYRAVNFADGNLARRTELVGTTVGTVANLALGGSVLVCPLSRCAFSAAETVSNELTDGSRAVCCACCDFVSAKGYQNVYMSGQVLLRKARACC
jgi:hypothetical protein